MSSEQREHDRFPVEVAGEVTLRGEIVVASTQNLSAGGVAVLLERHIPEGARIKLTLFLTQDGIEDPDEEPFETEGTVRWVTKKGNGLSSLGVQFSPLVPAQEQHLNRFLEAIKAANR